MDKNTLPLQDGKKYNVLVSKKAFFQIVAKLKISFLLDQSKSSHNLKVLGFLR